LESFAVLGGVQLSAAMDDWARCGGGGLGTVAIEGRPSPDCDRPNGGAFESLLARFDGWRCSKGGGGIVFEPKPFMDGALCKPALGDGEILPSNDGALCNCR
jgi:hypothetical protein